MRLTRSWPRTVPSGRAHVMDDVERLVIDGCSYGALRHLDDDVLLLEWDIAVGREDLLAFADLAREEDRVLVAPYRLYAQSIPGLSWAHRHRDGTPVDTGDPVCDLFGLGMAYLPREVLRAYFATDPQGHIGDTEFSTWHHERIGPTPIAWGVRPVHLHYEIQGLSRGI